MLVSNRCAGRWAQFSFKTQMSKEKCLMSENRLILLLAHNALVIHEASPFWFKSVVIDNFR